MKIPILFVLALLPLAILQGEEGQEAAPAAAPAKEAKTSAEEILKKLVETAKVELEEYNKTPENRGWSLDSFLGGLERQRPHGGFRSAAAAEDFMETAFPDGEGFAKSRALAKAYVDRLDIEIVERRKQFEVECIQSVSALMKRAVETQDPEKLEQMGEELDGFFREASQKANQLDERGAFRSSNISSDQSYLQSFVSQLSSFHSQRVAEQWSSAANSLQMLRRQVPRLERYLPADTAKGFIANCEKSIGLMPPEEAQGMFDATVAELLDDKNQDRLDAIQVTIRKQGELCRSSSKSVLSVKWQNLSQLASSFSQNVTRMKLGNPPQFSPEQWFRSNPDAANILGQDKLIELMKRYRVKWKDGSGEIREEPIYYDMNEVIARIQGPADIAREMPVFQKAVKQSSYSSDNGNWQTLGQRLQQYGELFAKLETGASFAIGAYGQSEYGYERSNNPVAEDAASKKAADLNQQLQWMVVQRFLPDVQADAKSTPAKAVADRFAQAKKGGDYQAMLTLGRLSAYLAPGQGLLTPQDGLAIQWYLDGVKQEEQLGQPRLATYYFQRSAAVPNSPIPPHVFKARLKNLKYSAPKDYDKGTDDALGRNLDSTGMGMQAPLMVPEKVTAEKVPSER